MCFNNIVPSYGRLGVGRKIEPIDNHWEFGVGKKSCDDLVQGT